LLFFLSSLLPVAHPRRYVADNGVKLVNIGAEDVHDGKLKLVLGMLWTLISNFSIVHRLRGNSDGKVRLSPP
jgi:hypothetical protein